MESTFSLDNLHYTNFIIDRQDVQNLKAQMEPIYLIMAPHLHPHIDDRQSQWNETVFVNSISYIWCILSNRLDDRVQ